MTGAIEGQLEAKESKSCLLCFIPSKAIQNCSPFDAEVADENKQKWMVLYQLGFEYSHSSVTIL